ncbi:MAG: hypothetical protein AAFU80_04945 [Pseudomonadota bacterium]
MARAPDKAKLARLAQLAEMEARAKRARLADAAKAEMRARDAVAAIDAQRAAALISLSARTPDDAVTVRTTSAWMRWAEGEQRRLSIALARQKAVIGELRRDTAKSIARQAVLEKLSKSN